MNDDLDFAKALRYRLEDAAAHVTAGEQTQQRIIRNAKGGRSPARIGGWARRPSLARSWMVPSAAALVVLLTAAVVLIIRDTSSATSSPPAGPATASASPSPTSALAQCTAPDDGAYEPVSAPDFVDHVVGTWLACGNASIFNTDEVGMQIDRDGHWAKLYRDPAGHLYAGASSRQYGSWTSVDVSSENGRPLWQLNLRIAGSGTVITVPAFSQGVPRIHLDNNAEFQTDYVQTSEQVRD